MILGFSLKRTMTIFVTILRQYKLTWLVQKKGGILFGHHGLMACML